MSLPPCDLVVFVTFHNTLGKYVFLHGIFLLFSLMLIFIVDCFALHLTHCFFPSVFLPNKQYCFSEIVFSNLKITSHVFERGTLLKICLLWDIFSGCLFGCLVLYLSSDCVTKMDRETCDDHSSMFRRFKKKLTQKHLEKLK